MTAPLARAVMAIASRCLGESGHEWALAMRAELDAAIEEGRPLTFAIGCLFAAWREMPVRAEGRLVLANYALALGMLIPMAILQFACAAVCAFPRDGGLYGVVAMGRAGGAYLAPAQLDAVAPLLGLWLLLCVLHLRLAWVLIEGDWSGVIRVASLIAAGTISMAIFSGVLFFDDDRAVLQAAALAIELMAISASARWQGGLFGSLAPREWA